MDRPLPTTRYGGLVVENKEAGAMADLTPTMAAFEEKSVLPWLHRLH
jgi:hypothetical protein